MSLVASAWRANKSSTTARYSQPLARSDVADRQHAAHPIHRYGWAVILIYWLITLPLLAVAVSFAGTNNTIAFGALIAIFLISMGCGAITISRTANR